MNIRHLYEGVFMLEERILRGLILEWRLAESFLPQKYRGLMKIPGFELRDMKSIWGMWEGNKKNIVMSRRLVHEYGWRSVREVLFHEMAHQFVSEVLGCADETSHGPRFHEACKLLNADPSASGSFPSIYERMEQDELEDSDRAMLRVKKLLAMAQSSNKNEAEVAMAKAHAYIAKYNIEIRSEDTRQTYCTMCVGESAVRQTADKYRLAAFLRHYYFVEGVWIPTFVVHDGRQGRVLELSGNVENVKMAEYVHGFLSRTITEQWDLYQAERWASKMQRTDFAIGLIDGFSQKLDAQKRAMECQEGQAFALIKVEDVRLKAYLNDRYPRLRQVGRHGRCIDEAVHGAGVEAGRVTILNKPIESGASGTVRMLTA